MEDGNLFATYDAVLFTILGFALSFLGLLVHDAIKNRRRRIEVGRTVMSELEDTRIILASNVFEMESKFGQFDRKLLQWLRPVFDNYEGPLIPNGMPERIRKMLTLGDEDFESLKASCRRTPDSGVHLKKVDIPYIEAHIADLGLFDESTQKIISAIRAKLGHFNENIDNGREYHARTFEDLHEVNAERVNHNLTHSYLAVSERARSVVEHINEILPLRDGQ